MGYPKGFPRKREIEVWTLLDDEGTGISFRVVWPGASKEPYLSLVWIHKKVETWQYLPVPLNVFAIEAIRDSLEAVQMYISNHRIYHKLRSLQKEFTPESEFKEALERLMQEETLAQ